MRATVFLLLAFFVAVSAARSADPEIPTLWDANERLAAPNLSDLERLRFLTTVDFPPFNYLDSTGQLTGFNVELARALCAELEVSDRCQIQALPWEELVPALEAGDGDAIIAGLAATSERRDQLAFSRPYLKLPARFVMRRSSALSEPLGHKLDGKRVGVIAGDPHERMLRDYFPAAQVVTYDKAEWLFGDLKEGKLDGAFGDGMRLSFWLAGSDAANCCRFAGGPYLAPEHLGTGLTIAVPKENARLTAAFDFALRELTAKGVFGELYLKHFPVSFF
ncbi:MAG: transporter substrate-binding domain-containing protein [Rhizobiaceae bacterium]|nr:transporter substrate-binding domain-containing protein [Rhizobiaceae bacterium]MCV0405865.1 transporter substrate-binding domain-containing protein [Rhizobiaceae bacterium]